MLHEFAVEPTVINSWDRLQLYLSNFGVNTGRLISEYPSDWEARVLKNGFFTYPTTARVEESLRNARDRLVSRYHRWNERLQWLENAEAEHAARPFHAIIASSNPKLMKHIIVDGFDFTSPPSRWRVLATRKVARKADALADAARLLLQMSHTIVFVDRNFDPKNKGYREGLKAFLLAMLSHRKTWAAQRIDYYCGDNKRSPQEFKSLCNAWLPILLPKGMQIQFVRWRYGNMHNRFILTDRGGIQFGHGLDIAGETESQDDNLTLLDATYSAEILQEFDGPSPRYSKDIACGNVRIVGINSGLIR